MNSPTPRQVAVDHAALGLGLDSPFLGGENGIGINSDDELVTPADAPLLRTCEEWVINTAEKTSRLLDLVDRRGEKL